MSANPAARHRYTRRTALRQARRCYLSPASTDEQRDEAREELLAYVSGRNRWLSLEACRAIMQGPLP